MVLIVLLLDILLEVIIEVIILNVIEWILFSDETLISTSNVLTQTTYYGMAVNSTTKGYIGWWNNWTNNLSQIDAILFTDITVTTLSITLQEARHEWTGVQSWNL